MNLTNLKDVFDLKGLPWIGFLGSALGLSLVTALVFRLGHPSGSVLWVLEFLGIDARAGVAAVHSWFIAPVRREVLTMAINILLVMTGASYATCHWKWLASDQRSWDEAESYSARKAEIRKRPAFGQGGEEDRRALLDREEKSHSEAFRREWDLRSWYIDRMMRLASIAWLLTALNIEINGLVLDPIVWVLAVAFVIVLLVMNRVKTDDGSLLYSLGAVAFDLGVSLFFSLVHLPAFIWARMTRPHTSRRAEGGADAGK